MPTHYLRARINRLVAGMDDTAVVAVEAESKQAAIERACEQHLDQSDFYAFTDEVWESAHPEGLRRPSTGPVHYLGPHEELVGEDDLVLLSGLEGEKVTDADLA